MFTLDNFYKSKEWEAFMSTVIADRTAAESGLKAHSHGITANDTDAYFLTTPNPGSAVSRVTTASGTGA